MILAVTLDMVALDILTAVMIQNSNVDKALTNKIFEAIQVIIITLKLRPPEDAQADFKRQICATGVSNKLKHILLLRLQLLL